MLKSTAAICTGMYITLKINFKIITYSDEIKFSQYHILVRYQQGPVSPFYSLIAKIQDEPSTEVDLDGQVRPMQDM